MWSYFEWTRTPVTEVRKKSLYWMTDWVFTPEYHIVWSLHLYLILDGIIKEISVITTHIIWFVGVLIELEYGQSPVIQPHNIYWHNISCLITLQTTTPCAIIYFTTKKNFPSWQFKKCKKTNLKISILHTNITMLHVCHISLMTYYLIVFTNP